MSKQQHPAIEQLYGQVEEALHEGLQQADKVIRAQLAVDLTWDSKRSRCQYADRTIAAMAFLAAASTIIAAKMQRQEEMDPRVFIYLKDMLYQLYPGEQFKTGWLTPILKELFSENLIPSLSIQDAFTDLAKMPLVRPPN